MWFLDQLKRAAQTVNQLGTGTIQDPTEFSKPQKLGRLGSHDVYTVQRRGEEDPNYCYILCVNQVAEYNRNNYPASFGGPIPRDGILLNRTTFEPIRYPVNSDGLPIIPEPASDSCKDDPRQVYTAQKFYEKVCNNSAFGERSHTVWARPIIAGKSCFGQYPPPSSAPTTGPNIIGSTDPGLVGSTLSPLQIAGVALAVGLVVAVPVAAIAISLIQCYRSLRGQAPSEASSEVTLEDALTFDNDDTVSVSSEDKLLEKD